MVDTGVHAAVMDLIRRLMQDRNRCQGHTMHNQSYV
jgi:hypothetical protein